ncbi:helix-turn-helix domain-containing protein [Chloroflexota bacterium]
MILQYKLIKVNEKLVEGMDRDKKVLTVKELAEELRISINLAYREVREGKIYSIKVGDRYLIPRKALDKLLSGEKEISDGGDK